VARRSNSSHEASPCASAFHRPTLSTSPCCLSSLPWHAREFAIVRALLTYLIGLLERCSLRRTLFDKASRCQPSFDKSIGVRCILSPVPDPASRGPRPLAEPIPEPPWWTSKSKAARKSRPPLTREGIVDAALLVLDRGGLDSLTMRRVAETLGVGAASLYWHV